MANALSKRLARLEELLSDRLNTPVAVRGFDADKQSSEQVLDAMVASGEIAAADRGRVKLVRWLTKEEYETLKPHSTWASEAGPPRDNLSEQKFGIAPPPAREPIEPSPEQIARYKEAVALREREIEQEKLDAAAKIFAKSIA